MAKRGPYAEVCSLRESWVIQPRVKFRTPIQPSVFIQNKLFIQRAFDAPLWLWSSIIEFVGGHEVGYLEHCRRFALEAA